jgi:hypothetical protein
MLVSIVSQVQFTENLNIRILIPRIKSTETNGITKDKYKNINIQRFDREIAFNEIILIVDHEYVFIIDIRYFDDRKENVYNAEFTNDKSKVLIYTNIFERTWLSEKVTHFS